MGVLLSKKELGVLLHPREEEEDITTREIERKTAVIHFFLKVGENLIVIVR